jgi:uncharacterized membrane protein
MRVLEKGALRVVFLGALSLVVWLRPGLTAVRAVSEMDDMEEPCSGIMQWMVGWCMGAEAAGDSQSVGALTALATAAVADAPQGGDFRSIDVDRPGVLATRAFGINPEGDIVGAYDDATGTHGYLLSNGVLTTVDVPREEPFRAVRTEAYGINSRGDIIGRYTRAGRAGVLGFLLSHGRFTDISVADPKAADGKHVVTLPTKIGASGEIVGCYHETSGTVDMYGYVQRGSSVTSFALPSAVVPTGSAAMHNGITPGGRIIVGLTFETATKAHGYVIRDGELLKPLLDFPGSSFTQAWDVNPRETIVGQYTESPGPPKGKTHGFYLDEGGYVKIDFPGAFETRAFGINPEGDIVGVYTDIAKPPVMHGFLLRR